MARRGGSFRQKLHTREHVIADLAVNHVERQGLLCGYFFEKFSHDYGFDLALFTYTAGGEMDDGSVLLQVKATEETSPAKDGRTVPFRVTRSDLVTWLKPLLPVVLVVYDVARDAAFWIHVQGYFQAVPDFNLFTIGQSVTMHLPAEQTLNPDAMRRFAVLRDEALRQLREGR